MDLVFGHDQGEHVLVSGLFVCVLEGLSANILEAKSKTTSVEFRIIFTMSRRVQFWLSPAETEATETCAGQGLVECEIRIHDLVDPKNSLAVDIYGACYSAVLTRSSGEKSVAWWQTCPKDRTVEGRQHNEGRNKEYEEIDVFKTNTVLLYMIYCI